MRKGLYRRISETLDRLDIRGIEGAIRLKEQELAQLRGRRDRLLREQSERRRRRGWE